MTGDMLSPDEIAALVAAAKAGSLPDRTEKARRTLRVRDLDFSRPTNLSPDQRRRLERAHESFCRSASTALTTEMRTPVEFEILNADQLTWSHALGDVPPGSLLCVVETRPLGTRLLLTIEQPVVARLIERLLGGTGATKPERRQLTEIELALVRRTLDTVLAQLTLVWDELFGLQLALVDIESQVANAQLVPPSEPTVVLTFEVRSEHASATLSILVPCRSIEPVGKRLAEGLYGDTHARSAAESVGGALGDVVVELRVEAASATMTLDDVLALRAGDLLELGTQPASDVTVYLDEVPIHRGVPGRNGSRRAVRVVERLEGAA